MIDGFNYDECRLGSTAEGDRAAYDSPDDTVSAGLDPGHTEAVRIGDSERDASAMPTRRQPGPEDDTRADSAVAAEVDEPLGAAWRIVGQGTVTYTKRYPSGLPEREVPYGHYYEVAAPGSDDVAAEIEFADRDGVDYFAPGGSPPVDLTVRARGNDGEFSSPVSGTVRLSYISNEAFILGAARVGVTAATIDIDNPTKVATDFEALFD